MPRGLDEHRLEGVHRDVVVGAAAAGVHAVVAVPVLVVPPVCRLCVKGASMLSEAAFPHNSRTVVDHCCRGQACCSPWLSQQAPSNTLADASVQRLWLRTVSSEQSGSPANSAPSGWQRCSRGSSAHSSARTRPANATMSPHHAMPCHEVYVRPALPAAPAAVTDPCAVHCAGHLVWLAATCRAVR